MSAATRFGEALRLPLLRRRPGQLNANFLIDYLWNEAANVHPSWYSQYGTGSSTTAKFLRGLELSRAR